MKGQISLAEFIKEVKQELVAGQCSDGAGFLELHEILLEASFAVDATAKAGAKFVVLELGGETKAQQCHKVTLKFQPLIHETSEEKASEAGRAAAVVEPKSSGGGSGGGGGLPYDLLKRRARPVYSPRK